MKERPELHLALDFEEVFLWVLKKDEFDLKLVQESTHFQEGMTHNKLLL